MLCSKNVSILAKSEEELENWSERRYRFARQVAFLWFQELKRLQQVEANRLQSLLSSNTMVGEMVGGSAAHLVHYGAQRRLQWFAVVSHHDEAPCWPPLKSRELFAELHLPTVVPKEAFGDKEPQSPSS